ncbi:MAG: hypothetical protein IJT59_06110 [Desulfovibrionaceae bacterium]|nr:hypothetical protein [Desulfovibrionaceae bacterium]
MRLLLLILCLALSACATQKNEEESLNLPPNCTEAWVYAPDNLILELSSGNQVLLDPAVHDFPLFCSKDEAKVALQKMILEKKYPASGWAYYKLAGKFANLAKVDGDQILLKESSSLVDWEQ